MPRPIPKFRSTPWYFHWQSSYDHHLIPFSMFLNELFKNIHLYIGIIVCNTLSEIEYAYYILLVIHAITLVNPY